MEQFLIWKVLGIEETKDIEAIKSAYHEHLKTVNPEDDQAGFMQLREAYEQAVIFAQTKENTENEEDEYESLKNGTEVDQFIYHMNLLYQNLELRTNEAEWDSLLSSYEDDLDGELQERVLLYIMSHHHFPWNIWKKLDKKFHYVAETELLKEKFPENFLNYVNYYILHDAFLDFELFEGETDHDVDDYINRYFDLKGNIENLEDLHDQKAVSSIEHEFKALDEYEIYHPYIEAEKLRFQLMCKEIKMPEELMLKDAKRLSGRYPDNFYINYYTGMVFLEFQKISEAKAVFEHLLSLDKTAFLAKMGMMKTQMAEENYADAKENCLDLLDKEERNAELNSILEELNTKLVPVYEKRMSENPQDAKNIIELGWCYFQQQRFADVERVLNSLAREEFDEYDYINLTGRNYLALEQYEKAVDYLIQWRESIDKTQDDGSRDNRKRLNRKGFSHFAVGLAHWYLGKKEEGLAEIREGIGLEGSKGYRMSYKDQLAALYLEEKDYDKVYEICNELIEEDEDYYPAYLKRQKAAFELHRGQDVIDDFYAAKSLYAGYAKPYVLAMRVFFYAGQLQDALNIYNQAQEEGLKSDELLLLYYKSMRILNKDKKNELSRLVSDFNSFKKECMGKKLLEKKDMPFDINYLKCQDKYTDMESFAGLYLEEALYRMALDDTAYAIICIDEGLKKYPDDIGLLEMKADLLWDKAEYEEAFIFYDKMLKNGYDAPSVYMMIGKYYKLMSNNDYNTLTQNAITNFMKVHEMEPENQECLYYLSRLFRIKFRSVKEKTARNDAGEKTVYYARKLYELDKCAFNAIELGLSYEQIGEYDKALSCYLKASELEPDNIYAHNNAGNLYIKQNRLQEAKAELLKSYELEDDDEPTIVYELLADLFERLQDYMTALHYVELQLKRTHPSQSQDLLRHSIFLHEKCKDYKAILVLLQKLFEYGFIQKYELCYYSAKYYYWDGNKLKAFRLYQEALKLTKGNSEARKAVTASKTEWKNDRK